MPEDSRRAGGAAWLDSLLYDSHVGHASIEAERVAPAPWPVDAPDELAAALHRAAPRAARQLPEA